MTYDNGPICPHCGGQTHYYDKAKRIVKGKYGESKKIDALNAVKYTESYRTH